MFSQYQKSIVFQAVVVTYNPAVIRSLWKSILWHKEPAIPWDTPSNPQR